MVGIVGLFGCFFGGVIDRLWSCACGFFIGIGIGVTGGFFYQDQALLWLLSGTLAGVALAVLLYYFCRIGAVIAGGLSGFFMALLLVYATKNPHWVLALTGAAVGAVGAAFLPRVFVLLNAALGGATAFAVSLFGLFTGADLYALEFAYTMMLGETAGFLLLSILLVATIGLFVQNALIKHRIGVDQRTRP